MRQFGKTFTARLIDSDTDESMAGDEVFTLLALMDIPLRQRTMEMYQAERNYVKPAIASADF